MRTYLDHAATTPMRPGVLETMLAHLNDDYGNPSSAHAEGRAARRAVEESREVVAELLHCLPAEVIFTSGATEANNLFLRGAIDARGKRAIASAIEHEAVLKPIDWLGGGLVAVDANGQVDLEVLRAAVDSSVSVVSIMAANNETGVIQPLGDIVRIVREQQPNAYIHSDAVQFVPWCDVSLLENVDAFSISAHKFGGPKGVGALVVRGDTTIRAQQLGGGQELERRSGTQNVAGIVGLASALSATVAQRSTSRVGELRDRLSDGIMNKVDGVRETGRREDKIANNAHLVIDGVESEALVFMLDEMGVAVSAASACASGAMQPSHVLLAMGYSRTESLSSLRLSLGWNTTEDDIDVAVSTVAEAVTRLRSKPTAEV